MMKKVATIQEFNTNIQTGKTIVMFSADWCGDCVYIEPQLPEIEADNPTFNFIHVDRDELLELCQDLAIFGIPSFVAFENGKETGRFVNKERKTKEEINRFVASLSSQERSE